MSDTEQQEQLRCPECGLSRFRVSVTAAGETELVFRDDGQRHYENAQLEVHWLDDQPLTCLNCQWTGATKDAAPQAVEALIQRTVRYLSQLPSIKDEDPTERIFLIKKLRAVANKVALRE